MFFSKKYMKTVGVIGGLGAETTSRFYLELISLCQKKSKIHRPPIMIWNIPITYKAELEEITNGVYTQEIQQLLVDAAKKLEKSGVNFLVLPCNSAHTFIDTIKKEINIPILNIIEETIKCLIKDNVSKVGLISTLITRNNKLYEHFLMSNGIKFLMPSHAEQIQLNRMILNLTLSKCGEEEEKALIRIINNLKKQGAKNIILACAALPALISKYSQTKIYDTMRILVNATVKEILNISRNEEDFLTDISINNN